MNTFQVNKNYLEFSSLVISGHTELADDITMVVFVKYYGGD